MIPTQWRYTDSRKEVVFRTWPDGRMESRVVSCDEIVKWIALGGVPLPAL